MSQFFGPGRKFEAAVLTDCFGIGDDGEGGGRSGGRNRMGHGRTGHKQICLILDLPCSVHFESLLRLIRRNK